MKKRTDPWKWTNAMSALNYGHKSQSEGQNRSMVAKNNKAKKCAIEEATSSWAYECILNHTVSARQNREDTMAHMACFMSARKVGIQV